MSKSQLPKILMVTYSDPDIYSPIINSARLLSRNGYQVHILGYYRGRANTVDYGDGIFLIRGNDPPGNWPDTIIKKIAGFYNLKRKIAQLLRTNFYCLVIGHDSIGFWAVAKICLPAKIPIIYHCHDFVHFSKSCVFNLKFSNIIASVSSKLSRSANAVIFPEQSRAAWATLTWRLSCPVLVVANAPLKQPLRKSDTLKKMFIKNGFEPEYIIVRKGAISFDHGLKETIEAMALCPSNWGLALIGYGDINGIRELAKKNGVDRQIIFTGFIPYDSTWDLISSADVGLSIYRPSDINTIMLATASQKVFEYMACGIPSIAYGKFDFLNLARETSAIYIINSITSEVIADGLKEVLSNKAAYNNFCVNAHIAHSNIFNYEVQYGPVIKLIDMICKKI